jgi:lipopolysaccharide exporter
MTAAGDVRAKAVRGIAWTVATGLGTRVLQMVGTLAFTHFVHKEAVGEVANAAIVAMTAHSLTTFGIPHYLVSRKTDRAAAWHATLLLGVSGLVAFAIALLLEAPLGRLLKSPGLGSYLPLLIVSTLLSRIATVPERLLQQQLRFGEASRARAAGELAYTIASLGLAMLGAGGMAIVAGNLARSTLWLALLSASLPPAEWATPHPFDRSLVRGMLAFGLPLGVALSLTFAARNWDNFIVSGLFGTAVVGAYSLAYNLADIPASQIGEQVGDVLTPSFAHLDEAGRKAGLVRATALLGLVVFPLAVGLGVSGPTIASTLLGPDWALVGPMLSALSMLSVARPIGWTIGSYLQTTQRSRAVMWLSALRICALLAAVAGLGRAFGPMGACAGVGVAFSLHALASAAFIVWQDGIAAGALLGAAARPLLACAPLVLAVLGTRAGLSALGVSMRGVGLMAEVVAGALGYAVGAFLFAGALTRDILRLAKELRRKRSAAKGAPSGGAAAAATSPESSA